MTEWLPDDHLVWFVIEAVRQLDTRALHLRAKLGGVGRRGYNPDMLLTLWIYAMACGERSSRQIERLCATDVAFRIICASDIPDHTVLASFRKDHEAALADLLTASLHLCAQLGVLRFGVVALDGVRIAANAAKDANHTEATLRRLAEAHLAAAEATDAAEDALFGEDNRGDELPEQVRDRTHQGRRIRQALAVIEARKAAEAAAAAERAAADQAAAKAYMEALADLSRPAPSGGVPKGVDPVEVAHARWQRGRAEAQRKQDAWLARAEQADRAGGYRPRGKRPAPVDEQRPVRKAYAAYQQALAAAQPAGTDLVPAQAGTDLVPTQAGTDLVPAQAGTDLVPAQAGTDLVPAQAGTDLVPAQAGTDLVPAQAGTDLVPTQAGTDLVPAQAGTDLVPAQAGTDLVPAQAGPDLVPTQAGTAVVDVSSTKTSAAKREPRANLTDPDSRLLKTRHGYIQGYNCMDAASEDQFIVYADATQDTNDLAQFEPIMNGVTDVAADLATRVAPDARDRFTVHLTLADAGFNSTYNLTVPGPDRLIAQGNSRTLHAEATATPATGDPPPDATPRQRMDHRLHTPEGHELYKRRSPLIEA